jgi:hypothetical protein
MSWQSDVYDLLRTREWCCVGVLFELVESQIPVHFAMRHAVRAHREDASVDAARWMLFTFWVTQMRVERKPATKTWRWNDEVRLRYVLGQQCPECCGPVLRAGYSANCKRVVCLACSTIPPVPVPVPMPVRVPVQHAPIPSVVARRGGARFRKRDRDHFRTRERQRIAAGVRRLRAEAAAKQQPATPPAPMIPTPAPWPILITTPLPPAPSAGPQIIAELSPKGEVMSLNSHRRRHIAWYLKRFLGGTINFLERDLERRSVADLLARHGRTPKGFIAWLERTYGWFKVE